MRVEASGAGDSLHDADVAGLKKSVSLVRILMAAILPQRKDLRGHFMPTKTSNVRASRLFDHGHDHHGAGLHVCRGRLGCEGRLLGNWL